jgi:Fe-S oxidoreductase
MAFNLTKCVQCGDCFEKCLYTDYDQAQAVKQINMLINNEPAQIVEQCITCAACNTYCTKGANPFDLLQWRQEASGRYQITESYNALIETIDTSKGEIIHGQPDKPVINICAVDVIPGLFEGALFEGCTFLSGGEYESVLGCIHGGKETPLKEKMPHKIKALAETGFNEIVMFHDDCYAAFTTKAIEYAQEVPFKVTHYVEYLKQYLQSDSVTAKPLDMKIAYQQPCSSRYTPWMDKHIDDLFDLCGVTRVAREFDRDNALCCGSPIGPHRGPDYCAEIKEKNIQDAKAHNAEAMVFMCPFCALQMRDEVADAGIEPIFLTNLVRMSLGESLSGHPAGLGDDREMIQGAVQIIKGQM